MNHWLIKWMGAMIGALVVGFVAGTLDASKPEIFLTCMVSYFGILNLLK
jgi:hypothetical protein